MKDDHAGDGVLLAVIGVAFLPAGRAVPQRGLWEDVQVSVALRFHRWLEDGVWEGDSRLQIRRTRAPQGLIARQFGAGEIHLFQTVHGDDCKNQHTGKFRERCFKTGFAVFKFKQLI